jgi:hypothetical protein
MLSQDKVSQIILAVVVLLMCVVLWWFKWKKKKTYIHFSDWDGTTPELDPKQYNKGISIGGTHFTRKTKTKQKNKK